MAEKQNDNNSVESYVKNNLVNFKINNVKVKLYDDNFQLSLKPLNLSIRVEDQKFVGNKVEIIFSPIELIFTSINENDKPTNLFSVINVQGFKLNIDDDLKTINSKFKLLNYR